MNVGIFIITLLIFLDTIGYAVYEIKDNHNQFGGSCVIILSIIMIVFVNYSMFTFK